MKENGITLLLAAAMAALGTYCKELMGPILLAAMAMACDYFTGVGSAWVRRALSSREGVVGFVKKIGLAMLIGVGVIVDWVIRMGAEHLGVNAPGFCFFGLLVTFWITMNECISIVENIAEMGVDVPPFLEQVIKRLKASTERKGSESAKEE